MTVEGTTQHRTVGLQWEELREPRTSSRSYLDGTAWRVRTYPEGSRAVMWGRVLDFRVTFYDVILKLTAVLARSIVSDLGK